MYRLLFHLTSPSSSITFPTWFFFRFSGTRSATLSVWWNQGMPPSCLEISSRHFQEFTLKFYWPTSECRKFSCFPFRFEHILQIELPQRWFSLNFLWYDLLMTILDKFCRSLMRTPFCGSSPSLASALRPCRRTWGGLCPPGMPCKSPPQTSPSWKWSAAWHKRISIRCAADTLVRWPVESQVHSWGPPLVHESPRGPRPSPPWRRRRVDSWHLILAQSPMKNIF